MNKDELIEILNISKERGITEKQVCIEKNIKCKNLYYTKKKFGLLTCSRGKNENSKKQRVYNVDDNFFETPNLSNSYWAGFIAADGCIDKKYKTLSFGLSKKDEIILENLKKDLSSNYNIRNYKSKGFDCVGLNIMSEKICLDLKNNFNITYKKSLTLIPPLLEDIELVDAFIVGYIDGDGSIGLYDDKKQKTIQISLLGTIEICSWIKERFDNILKKEYSSISKNKSYKDNTYNLKYSDKSARFLFQHFYNISVQKLDRKWKKEYYEHCINFKKYKNVDKYMIVLDLYKLKLSQTEIAKRLGMTSEAISWYESQPLFKELMIENNIEKNDRTTNRWQEEYYKKYKSKLSKKVYQYSLDGVLLNTFDSTVDAQNNTNINNISQYCLGKRRCEKYIWSYIEITN